MEFGNEEMALTIRNSGEHTRNMAAINFVYPSVLELFGGHVIKGGTESRALLAWFLENYYRLDEEEIYLCVCDGHGDKGIDGIYVNEQLRQIDVFQSTVVKANKHSFGDGKIKQFRGAVDQLSTVENATRTISLANAEVQAIAKRTNLIPHISEGFQIRGVFVNNGKADASAKSYEKTQPLITIYDELRLRKEFVAIDKTDPISTPSTFDISGTPTLPWSIGKDVEMVIAPILASELVTLTGIENGELFAWNVRQFLGKKTTVNASVSKSIGQAAEHKYFPAFHNGVTILCKTISSTKDSIKISGHAVVNGCQSITSLYENRKHITSDLRILTKFIQVEHDSELASRITDHTNNQNGITARDLQSNSLVQTRLQSEIHGKYPTFRYRIKRGEHPGWSKTHVVIENELLARIILAFDLNRPESWSQNYKLFDDLHAQIFGRKEVNADRAIFLYEMYLEVMEKIKTLDDQLFASFTLTRWLVLHLLREALLTDKDGKSLYQNPSSFLQQKNGRERVRQCVADTIQTIVRLLDGAVTRRKDNPEHFFNYKDELKSKDFVVKLTAEIIPQYRVMIDGKIAKSFSEKWKESTA
jgi:hypothetical protein